jgi:hypothetical protein
MYRPDRVGAGGLLVAAFCALTSQWAFAGAPQLAAPGTLPPACDRQCLYGFVDQYLAALESHDANRLPWASDAKYTENNVHLAIGDGIWGTASGLGRYRLKFADPQQGQVGVFGEIKEPDSSSAFALRLRIADGRIAEAETVIVRINDFGALPGGANPFANPRFDDKPIFQQDLAPLERRPRARLVSVADGYFDTLQLNDGQVFTEFDPACNRVENGLLTTNNPAKPLGPLSALGCLEQFKLGQYRYDDRIRARRFPLVDEERGLVLAAGFIDHAGRLGTYKLADGTVAESPIRRPHTFVFLELFKIVSGRIRQVEAVFITVPYNMPSPWAP